MRNKVLKLSLIVSASLSLAFIAYFGLIANKSKATKYATNLLLALNNEQCSSLYPSNKIRSLTNEIACPRGDVGNYMVIDKVEYKLEGITGSKFGNHFQALIKVCVHARGNASWNEGEYYDCTTDARIINLKTRLFTWRAELVDFTNLSVLLSKSGAMPQGYEESRKLCWELRVQNYLETGEPVGRVCNNAVGSDIVYSIKTHKFVETGKAH